MPPGNATRSNSAESGTLERRVSASIFVPLEATIVICCSTDATVTYFHEQQRDELREETVEHTALKRMDLSTSSSKNVNDSNCLKLLGA
jgi:hypothetical protein